MITMALHLLKEYLHCRIPRLAYIPLCCHRPTIVIDIRKRPALPSLPRSIRAGLCWLGSKSFRISNTEYITRFADTIVYPLPLRFS